MKKNFKKVTYILLFVLLLIPAAGCSKSNDKTTSSKPAATETIKTKDFKSDDGKLQVSAPTSWKEVSQIKSMNPLYKIGIGDLSKEKYLGVISESKDNFDGMTLDKYYDAITSQLKTQITDAEISNVTDITISGSKAKIFQLKGTVNNVKITYINAIIDSPKAFNQVNSWTLTSSFDKNKSELENAVKSFKELS
ncbi:hypothetical protein IAI10_10530 [Clostridium sp. 19966]|uniref:hypothetical protein n=1 Tax=Clostridium sp. 19966 TaxID=2768166 RepID=UPI0028DE4530|nr:hypothetical protein [Clostridium sp. 19966]MDT8717095.1 hypothetical protein [Clostridium sp. 19966]